MATPSSDSTLTPLPSSAAPLSPTFNHNPTPSTSSSLSSPYLSFRSSVRSSLHSLSETLAARRAETGEGVGREEMEALVKGEMDRLGLNARAGEEQEGADGTAERWKRDTRQAAVARALEELVNEAAIYPSTPSSFAHLTDIIDLVLCMWEAGHVEETLPLNILTGLMELRPIAACEPLFGYIEGRVERLTKGMEYQRGRGPILLRLLNDLLRRLPRSQSAPVILSGRILLLLSSVYPLGEKSGVNLRGNFNTGKGGVVLEEEARREMDEAKKEAEKEEEEEEKVAEEAQKEKEVEEKEKMEVEEGEEGEEPEVKKGDEKKDGKGAASEEDDPDSNPAATNPSQFYTTFWSLQKYFNNPHLLFAAPKPSITSTSTSTTGTAEDPFSTLHHGLLKTLSAFRAATKRERELAGAAKDEKSAGGKGKEAAVSAEVEMKPASDVDAVEDPDKTEESLEQYFFPKFLTSRNLLDLELADPSFRRQLLLQTLILLQYLLSLTPSSRQRASSLPVTNQSAFPSFVLQEKEEKWVREVRERVLNELDAMSLGGGGGGGGEGGEGRRFRKAVQFVLQREQNWTDWKLRSCASFTRSPLLPPSAQSETARGKMRALAQKPKAFPFKLGNPQLSRAWERNVSRLGEMEQEREDSVASADDLNLLFRDHRLERNRLKQAEAQLKAAPPGSAKRFELEGVVEQRRTRLQALQWRAIRLASTSHLSFFNKIGAGDLDKLQQLIDEERRAKEEAAEAAEKKEGEGEEKDGEAEGGYESEDSVLGFGREKREREEAERKRKLAEEEEEREKKEREEKERLRKEEEERERVKKEQEEAGTPPPPPTASTAPTGDVAMSSADNDEGGETPPRPAPAADEPGTPPPKSTTLEPSPGTPGTPKRPRPAEDEGEDVQMKEEEGGGAAKRPRRGR